MTTPMIRIHDVATGEITDREMTSDEIKQFKADEAIFLAKENEEKSKAAEKIALLNRLGITEDEAKLLLA